jgi:hypothetical protein
MTNGAQHANTNVHNILHPPVLVLDVASIQQLGVKITQVGQRQQVLRGPGRAAPCRAADNDVKRHSNSTLIEGFATEAAGAAWPVVCCDVQSCKQQRKNAQQQQQQLRSRLQLDPRACTVYDRDSRCCGPWRAARLAELQTMT